MTPDKIYFPADGLPAYIDWDGSPINTKPVGDNDICYIRKDTLIEWAKQKQYESLTIVADDFWQEVIEKIDEI